MLAYLSRYTHRVAISNSRLKAYDETGVTFRYKDYRRDGPERQRLMTLAPHEFIRRFQLHVPPQNFHRIRHCGLLASSACKANPARARDLLAVARLCAGCSRLVPAAADRMRIIETFERWTQPPRAAPRSRSNRDAVVTRHDQCSTPAATRPCSGDRLLHALRQDRDKTPEPRKRPAPNPAAARRKVSLAAFPSAPSPTPTPPSSFSSKTRNPHRPWPHTRGFALGRFP